MRKQIVTQFSNDYSQQLLSQIETDEVQKQCYGKAMGIQDDRSEIGFHAPVTSPDDINIRAADMKINHSWSY